jgi:uncharacterized protein (UPF0261 family)
LERTVHQTERRRLIRVPFALNDPRFADALVEHFRAVLKEA